MNKEIKSKFYIFYIFINGKVLDYLLSIDYKSICETIFSRNDLLLNPFILIILGEHNLLDIGLFINKIFSSLLARDRIKRIEEHFYKDEFERCSKLKIKSEEQELLDEFKNIMLEDSKSDIEIINLAVVSFKYLFFTDYPYAQRDLENLINIKLMDKRFCLRYNKRHIEIKNRRSHFNKTTKHVYINNKYSINVFNHEITHVFYHYLTQDKGDIPEGFKKYLDEDCKKYRGKLDAYVENFFQKFMIQIESTNQIKREIRKIFKLSLYDKMFIEKDAYYKIIREDYTREKRSGRYSKKILNFISNNMIDRKNFEKRCYNALFYEIQRHYLDFIFQADTSFQDILDAISEGKLRSYGYKMKNNVIYEFSGHGQDAYSSNPVTQFDEILAEYISLLKSPLGEEFIDKLKHIFGNEFIQTLDEYYEKMNLYVNMNKRYLK